MEYEETLQAEIVERECILAAVKVLRGHAENGRTLKTLDFGVLGSALRLGPAKTLLLESPAAEAASAPPKLPPVKPYMHPDLAPLWGRHGGNTAIVRWAIQRMTADYSLTNIQRLLKSQGAPLRNAEISVVLTRLKSTQQIEEIAFGRGPKGSVFRKPDVPLPVEPPVSTSSENADAQAAA